MSVRTPRLELLALAVAIVLPGCAGSGLPPPSLSAPSTPQVGSIAPEGVVAIDQPAGSATDLYARIASGAMSCWFAVGGPLKKDYIFHATADAPSRGGKAEIVIHQRDPTQPNPRGAKAYLVEIEPTGESTASIKAQNLKMSEAFASEMTADIGRWSKGDQGCIGSSTTAGWAPAPPEPPPSPAKPQSKAKKAKATTVSKPAANP